MTTLPMARFKVLDLTRARAGPTAVRQLADMGADVIKIEDPGESDSRSVTAGERHGFDFQNLHRNKRSLTIDMKNPEGHALFLDLVKQADVVVENFRSAVKHRLKIDYDSLKAVNPKLVYGSISGFGQDGPYGKRPGVDQVAQALGGLMSITGLPGQGPVRVGIPITDLCAGMFLAQGILLALLNREHTGKGQWVHTSLVEAMTFMLDFQATRWLQDGEVPPQAGNDHPTRVPQGCYQAADGKVNVAAAGNIFPRFCEAVGAEHILNDPDFATDTLRSENRARLNEEIEKILATRKRGEWVEMLNDAGVPCAPVNSIDETFSDPQVQHLGVVRQVEHARLGRLDVVRQPVNLSENPQPQTFRYPTPDAGEHNDSVLAEFGIDAERIAALKAANAI